jgi:hypothetical protein
LWAHHWFNQMFDSNHNRYDLSVSWRKPYNGMVYMRVIVRFHSGFLREFLFFGLTLVLHAHLYCPVSLLVCIGVLGSFSFFIMWVLVRSHIWFLLEPLLSGLTSGFYWSPCCLVSHLVFIGAPVVWSHIWFLLEPLLSGLTLGLYDNSYSTVSHFLLCEFLSGLPPDFNINSCCLVSYRVYMAVFAVKFLTFYYLSSCPFSHLVFIGAPVVWSHIWFL